MGFLEVRIPVDCPSEVFGDACEIKVVRQRKLGQGDDMVTNVWTGSDMCIEQFPKYGAIWQFVCLGRLDVLGCLEEGQVVHRTSYLRHPRVVGWHDVPCRTHVRQECPNHV